MLGQVKKAQSPPAAKPDATQRLPENSAGASAAASCVEVVGCPDCGKVQTLPLRRGGVLHCLRCDSPLERMNGRSLDATLACALTTFLLLFPANLLPMLQVTILSATNTSVIASGVLGIGRQGWPLVAAFVGLEIVLLPFVRFGLLAVVLAALRLGSRAHWLGPAFRWSQTLDQWAMIDVFLFGSIVARDLAARLPKADVLMPGDPLPPDGVVQVEVNIQAFRPDAAGKVTLDADWSLIAASGGARLAGGRFHTIVPGGPGGAAAAQSMSAALGQLADAIAHGV